MPFAAVLVGVIGMARAGGRRRWGRGIAYGGVLAAAALLGLGSGGRVLHPPPCRPPAACALGLPRALVVEGWLVTEPAYRAGRQRFDLEVAARFERGVWFPLRGRVRIWARGLDQGWHTGACLRGRVWLRRPRNFRNPGAFDYVGYLRRRGIRVTASLRDAGRAEACARHRPGLGTYILAARRRVAVTIDAIVDPAIAPILRALVLGERAGIPRPLRAAYSRAGVAHLLAISGLHLAVVAGAVFAGIRVLVGRSMVLLAGGMSQRVAALCALPAALAYAALAGARPPTLRAASMIAIHLVGIACYRRSSVGQSLALAALALGIVWPGAVFDASFQLSFVAVLSIWMGNRRLRWMVRKVAGTWERSEASEVWPGRGTRTARRALAYLVGGALAATCASLGTAPLAAFHFNSVSLLGPLVNVVAVPLYSAAVVSALAGAGLAFFNVGVAAGPLLFAGWVLRVAQGIVLFVAGIPGAAIRIVTPTPFELWIAYALLGLLYSAPRRARLLLAGIVLVGCVDGAYWLHERYCRSTLRVTFLDVGQGDAAVVEFPGSAVLVVDGGGFGGSDFDPGEAIVARFLWQRKIGRVDYVVMSHAEVDHAGGLGFLVRTFRPREFLWNGRPGKGRRFEALRLALASRDLRARVVSSLTEPWMIGPVEARVINPSAASGMAASTNDVSVVLRLRWGGTTVLFPGDIERVAEYSLVRQNAAVVKSRILKVPHHGSSTSSSAWFLDTVMPEVAIISVGAVNRYGFPHQSVMRRYAARGICLRRTDLLGAVTIEATATGYRVEPPCGGPRSGR